MDGKSASKPKGLRPCARSFVSSIQEFLCPAIWKQAESARGSSRSSRWSTQPLVLCLLLMTWCCGDSQAERFETAKGLTAACLIKRRRPGKTVQGFQKALARLPMVVFRVIATGIRRHLLRTLDLYHEGFIAFGCDGSSMSCPRTAELEKYLDTSVKGEAGAPQVWVTAFVHLRTGLLWAWRLGKGLNRERAHLLAMLKTLPASALLVADPGFNGYELSRTLTAEGVAYLIRMSGKDRLYTLSETPLEMSTFESGEVLSWPTEARRAKLPPQRVRLLCIRSKTKRDVWLLTNVLDETRLTQEMASRYYRQRWENEGLFRTYKQTMKKMKLTSRTVHLVHREAEGSLLATQILLAMGASVLLKPTRSQNTDAEPKTPLRSSPRKILLVIREVGAGRIGVRNVTFQERIEQALQEHRPNRTTLKETRAWPNRTPHKIQKPPKCLMLSDVERALASKYLASPT